MAEDWDLSAIVRSCTSATNINTSNTYINTDSACQNANFENPLDCLATLTFGDDEDDLFPFPDLLHSTSNGGQELQDSYKPFLPSTIDQGNILGSSISDFGGASVQNQPQLVQQQPLLPPPPLVPPPTNDIPLTLRFNSTAQQKKLHQQGRSHQRPDTTTSVLPLRTTQSQAPSRSRKKKNHLKRQVMQVTADNLCNDAWAWRKYGQKPIKGSPYPRNYYRCSSSKGCAARKQVERSNTDPNMFIVSYTGDHTHPRPTHRNSLAGSTRNKFPTTIQKPAASKESEAPSGEKEPSSSPLSATSDLSPTTPLSGPMDHDAPNENINTVAGNIDGADMELESDGDGDGDRDGIEYEDDGDILIPNMIFNEDLIKGLRELGSTVGEGPFGGVGSTRNGGLGHSPDFGDNFSSWSVGSSTAAAAAGAGSFTGGE